MATGGTRGNQHGWARPPSTLTLGPDDLHVWRVNVDALGEPTEDQTATLADDEVARARRFRFEADRRRFILRRAVLRELLARYLRAPASTLCYRLALHGKPELRGPSSLDLKFNLSHSAGLVLIAFTRDREVGVDVERIVARRADRDVVSRFFAPAEVTALQQFDGPDWIEAFFRCWTRKEAYIKARGEGLSFPLQRFEVSVAPDEPARILHVDGDDAEAERWWMRALQPGPGFAGAVVTEGVIRGAHLWNR